MRNVLRKFFSLSFIKEINEKYVLTDGSLPELSSNHSDSSILQRCHSEKPSTPIRIIWKRIPHTHTVGGMPGLGHMPCGGTFRSADLWSANRPGATDASAPRAPVITRRARASPVMSV